MLPQSPDHARDVLKLMSVFVGYLVGVTVFVILFGILKNVNFALLGALFIGAMFGLAVFYINHRK